MTELARLRLTDDEHKVDIILTETSLVVEADSELHQHIAAQLHKADEAVEAAPKFVAWFAKKMITFGASKVEEIFREHPLGKVEMTLGSEELHLTLGGQVMNLGGLHYNRDEANHFIVAFRAHKRKLGLG